MAKFKIDYNFQHFLIATQHDILHFKESSQLLVASYNATRTNMDI